MKTIETVVYQYDELGPEAQEKARGWWREGALDDCYWTESVIEDAKSLGALMGITVDRVFWSGFWSQGDGACFEGRYSSESIKLRALKTAAPGETELHRIARELRDMRGRTWLKLSATVKQSGHYYHPICTSIAVRAEKRNGDVAEVTVELEAGIVELMRDFMDWIYKALEKEYEYQVSDENVAEIIRANEYDFDAEGNRV